MTGCCLY